MNNKDKIDVDKVKWDTIDFLFNSLDKTRAHTVKLFRNTKDIDGLTDVNDWLALLEDHLNEFNDKHMDG